MDVAFLPPLLLPSLEVLESSLKVSSIFCEFDREKWNVSKQPLETRTNRSGKWTGKYFYNIRNVRKYSFLSLYLKLTSYHWIGPLVDSVDKSLRFLTVCLCVSVSLLARHAKRQKLYMNKVCTKKNLPQKCVKHNKSEL